MFTNAKSQKESNLGPPDCKPTTLSNQLPCFWSKSVNVYSTHTKGRTFKAFISQTKAHWLEGWERWLFIFCILSIGPIFVKSTKVWWLFLVSIHFCLNLLSNVLEFWNIKKIFSLLHATRYSITIARSHSKWEWSSCHSRPPEAAAAAADNNTAEWHNLS